MLIVHISRLLYMSSTTYQLARPKVYCVKRRKISLVNDSRC